MMQSNTVSSDAKQHYRWLMQLSQSARLWLLLAIGIGLCSGVLLIVQAGLLARVIDQASQAKHVLNLRWVAFVGPLLSIIAIRSCLAWLKEVVATKAAIRVKTELRERLFKQLLSLTPLQCKRLDRGQTVTAIIEQVEALHGFIADYLPQMSLAVLLPLVILVWVFPLNGVAGWILLLTAPLIPLFMALVGMGAQAIHQRHFRALQRLGGYFLNTLQGLNTLKLFGRSQQEARVVRQMADEYRVQTMSVLKVAFLSSAVLELLSSVAIAIVAVYLGLVLLGLVHFGAAHGISLYAALFILLLAPEFYQPLRQLASHYHAKAEAVAAAQAIIQLLDSQASAPLKPLSDMSCLTTVSIACHQVCFQYADSAPLLDAINFTVNHGQCIGIEGVSGAGKSTLLEMLMGLLVPTSGIIRVNGTLLSELNADSWMHSLAYISQRTRLLSTTLRRNLLLAHPSANEDELWQALRWAQLDDWVAKQPEGLDTPIGEDNAPLSGGQVQRVALARAYLKKAPLWLLDEPTANLDFESERKVMAALEQLLGEVTLIIVSHQSACLSFAQQVYRLSQGALLPVGDGEVTKPVMVGVSDG